MDQLIFCASTEILRVFLATVKTYTPADYGDWKVYVCYGVDSSFILFHLELMEIWQKLSALEN